MPPLNNLLELTTAPNFFGQTQDVITSLQRNPSVKKLIENVSEDKRKKKALDKKFDLMRAFNASMLPDEEKYRNINAIKDSYQQLLGLKDYWQLPDGKGTVKQSDINKWVDDIIKNEVAKGYYSGYGDEGLLSLGATNIGRTPEGVPVINVQDVQSFSRRPVRAFYASRKENPFIVMPSASDVSMTPRDKYLRDIILQHEIGHHKDPHIDDYSTDVKWEHRRGEIDADRYALNVLKENLSRAGMPFTPEVALPSILKDDKVNVIPNPVQVPFLNRLDYLPTSGYDVKERASPTLDALGRINQGSTMDIGNHMKNRKNLGLSMLGANPSLMFGSLSGALPDKNYLTYKDRFGDRRLYNYDRHISRYNLINNLIGADN